MNPSNREGWPNSSSQPGSGSQQASDQSPSHQQPPTHQASSFSSSGNPSQGQQPSQGSLLPRPPSPYHPGSRPVGPSGSFPPISATANGSSSATHGPIQPQEPSLAPRPNPPPSQGAQYPLPGIYSGAPGQALSSQSGYDRDRESQEAREREIRDRDMDAHARREQQDRDALERDARDRHQRDHQSHSEQTPLYQPVAVGPQARSIHGPNGLLANPMSQQASTQASSPSASQAPLFGPHMNEGTPHQQAAQLPQQPPVTFPPPQMQQGPGQQPILNDALSYLDQVKVQFAGRPNVYNQFLDIMKDFKSQAIDTPGVIRRVSSLFAGNPNLIQGFNTFLPPGYRIECGTDGDPNGIRVTTPMGHTVSPMGTALESRPPVDMGAGMALFNSGHSQDQWGESREPHPDHRDGPGTPGPAMRSQEPRFGQARLSPMEVGQREHVGGMDDPHLVRQQEQQGAPHLQSAAPGTDPLVRHPAGRSVSPSARSAAAGDATAGGPGQPAAERKGPVEFNHAISYVNKIKNRFAQQPEIYKQFLEILQTYQRESKPIQDVYAQVTHLFNDAPDLLQDFKQFLPESAAHAKAVANRQAAEDMTMQSALRGSADGAQGGHSRHTPRPEQRLPPVGNFAPTPSASRDSKRKRGDRQGPVGGVSTIGHDLMPTTGTRTGFGPNKRSKHAHQQASTRPPQPHFDDPTVSPTLVPALPDPMPPQRSTAASQEELNFFERVKKALGNKIAMNEFLKLCNLFTQDLIDKNVLVYRARSFLGENTELFNWFKAFVNFDGTAQSVDNKPRAESGRVSLNNCRGYGPSYRLMPKLERLKICSGRDELCHSVLNNDWVSHPTWASEDSGFIAHRKNIHEEGLHRIEEERHDYDHHIAVCERAIQILEPFAQQIALFANEDDRSNFRLPADLGGQSQAIFKRTLTKIYGREYGLQVLSMLPQNPSSVVPIVLMRMRQKAEEWKLSQREWEKIWREQTQKMFWRSLDHQGINAKMTDKRQFQTKTLQQEIQVKHEEQKRVRQGTGKPDTIIQMQWTFSDQDVLTDASALLLAYSEAHHSSDVGRLTTLIKEFIPLFFGIDNEAFHTRLQEVSGSSPASEEADDDAHVSDDSGVSRGRRANGRKQPDLLRDVLEKGRKSARNEKEGSVASGSRATTPDLASQGDQDMTDVAEAAEAEVKNMTWIPHTVDGNISSKKSQVKPNEPFKRSVFNLYANLPIYCFFRVFVILYERLLNIKNNEKEVHELVRRAKMSKTAIELKLVDKHPDNFFSDTSPSANYYSQVLGMLESSVKRDEAIEQSHIEEILRRFYLQNGWMLYSFEKMLASIVRYGVAILGNESKERSNEILQLFLKDRRKESTTHQNELVYRKQVEKHVKDGDIYRISYNPSTTQCTARILKHEETTFEIPEQDESSGPGNMHMDGVYTSEQRWHYYVASFRSMDPTEGVPQDQVILPFLKRHLNTAMKAAVAIVSPSADDPADGDADAANGENTSIEKSATRVRVDQLLSYENLKFRISIFTYKLEWSDPADRSKPGEEIEEWWITTSPQHHKGREQGGTAEKKDGRIGEAAVATGAGTSNEAVTAEKEGAGAESTKSTKVVHDREHEHEAEERQTRFEEKFVMNNKWMAGLSRDAVDGINKEYREWIGGATENSTRDVPEATATGDPQAATKAANEDEQGAGDDVNMGN